MQVAPRYIIEVYLILLKTNRNMKLRILYAFAALALMMSSCTSSKTTLTYFDNRDDNSGVIPTQDISLNIAPNDELLITVTSSVPEATAVYNLPLSNPAQLGSIESYSQATQQTYIVNQSGDINFPILGKIHVEGMTTQQLTDYLTEKIEADVNDPYVRVELLNFKVNVLGEVTRPGSYLIRNQRYSIFDALADAGDLTAYGERSRVVLIRDEKGQRSYHNLNLNDVNIIASPYFYLRQNDVLYVEPNEVRKDNAEYNQNNAFKLSVISAIISACSIVASLVIALAINK